ncbi:MAG: tetratricopeptide repeat protein [Flavobacteriaceae bacterium]|nr:tetratricopeptide repeat protein [Flavobacteriaceae bacterium]
MSELDSIAYLIEKANDRSLSNIEKLSFAESAKRLSEKIKNDTLKNQALRYIAVNQFRLKNYNLFKKAGKDLLEHSIEIKDSFTIAKANVYLGQFYSLAKASDSAYFYFYNAEKTYRSINEKLELGKTLLKIAIIQKNEKDFIGSEVSTIEAISLLESSDEYEIISSLYNNLGIIYNELGDFNESIQYHEKALEYLNRINPPKLALENNSRNNIAVVYKNAEQYNQALENFNQILQNVDLVKNDFYALVLDNYAHTKFLLGQTEEIPELYLKALRICDSIGDTYKPIAINEHLSKYYQSINRSDSAKYYAYQAKNLASEAHNDDYLKALLHLSEVEEDSLAVKYYQEYIALNDSLINNERAIRNKFARIRYETKEIEKRNEQITRDRLFLLILSIALILTIFLTYSTISQRSKNKELKLNQLQQEANEEIYNLMLTQQDKIEEGRSQEKKRISEELHDGVLGRLFGTRLSLDSLNEKLDEDTVKSRSEYLKELKAIEEEIRKISHDLNTEFVSGSGFFDIIKTLVENQTQAYDLKYELHKNEDIDWESISNKTKINIYRIIQESLLNIYKHANAKLVKINFELKNNFVLLEITDDGDGFDINKVKKGIGLKNIASRVEGLGGDLDINSMRGKGTTILVLLPNK